VTDGAVLKLGGRLHPPLLAPMVLATLAVAALSLSVGAFAVPLATVASILWDAAGGDGWVAATTAEYAVVIDIRFPRVIQGALVGATLAVGGAVMQGLFRNPLADPGLIGISAGSAVAAIAAITLGVPSVLGALGVPLAAFAGGLGATVFVFTLGTRAGITAVTVMLLAGIGINAFASSITGLFVFLSDEFQLREFMFWTLGSLGAARWDLLAATAPLFLASLIALPALARSLNAIVLGEREAGHLGIELQRLKAIAIVFTALGIGVATATSGIIVFVGIVVPHAVRLVIGADHRLLLPVCVFAGASFMMLADIVARTVASPAELPIGVVTAAIGAPFFLWLIVRRRIAGLG